MDHKVVTRLGFVLGLFGVLALAAGWYTPAR
jgi:hypothetical protein